ncbi:MAG: 16S rRNA (cytidine(1402)-2'-O)-methyltransferase [Treponema sp.]|nr:MAG: 16S rRNA (cytidine(1402)-2'-O)-methyltransferase [Treponema sp.]
MSQLFIVATPIGNLGDMTFRAVDVLKEVDVVACEDTRHSLKLLNHFGIHKPLVSCRARNEADAAKKIVGLLDDGKDVAYVSDAGTPAVSDPGAVLVRTVRNSGHSVLPIPGVSAFAAILSVAGFSDKEVIFAGFLPQKGLKRKTRIKKLLDTGCGVVLYESPYRILKLLGELAEIDCELRVVIARELTKMHEEVLEGNVSDLLQDFSGRVSIKGEFCIFITGNA